MRVSSRWGDRQERGFISHDDSVESFSSRGDTGSGSRQ
jgi:hypothetical protein